MFKNEYTLLVDIKKTLTSVVPTFVQFDNATLVFKIYDNGKPFNLSNFTKAEITHKRPDGVVVVGDGNIETINGEQVIRYTYLGSEMAVNGFVQTSLSIYSEDKKVSIQPFNVNIIEDIKELGVDATKDVGIVQKLITDVENSLNAIKKEQSVVNVKGYGAKGDGITDDTDAIRSALVYCDELKASGTKAILTFPSSQGYLTKGSIIVKPDIDVIMDSPIIYAGALNEPCLIIGETGISTKGNYKILVQRKSLSDWSSENCIGVKFLNPNTCDIYIEETIKFTIGAQFMASSTGCAYNKITLGTIQNNKYGIDLTTELGGWCNENIFTNGRIFVNSNTNSSLPRFGIRITSKDLSYIGNNNNVFNKPSIEITDSGTNQGAIPILIEHGMQNAFYDVRPEGEYSCALRTLNGSTRNYVSVGYGVATIEQLGEAGDNVCEYNYLKPFSNAVTYSFTNLHKKANQYTDNQIYVPGLSWEWGEHVPWVSSVDIQQDCLFINSNRSVEISIDTTTSKRFMASPIALEGFGGRVYVVCYDAQGNLLLDDTNGSKMYIKGTTNRSLFWSASNQSYSTGSDSGNPIYFLVHKDVKKIRVLFTKGTNALKIQGFSITSLDGATRVYSELPEKQPGMGMALKPPTLGTYQKGKVLMNDNPIEMTDENGNVYIVEGWICVTAGTPGTWKEKRAYTGGTTSKFTWKYNSTTNSYDLVVLP